MLTVTMKLEDEDTGFEAVRRNLAAADGVRVDAGLFSEEQASKAAYAELGTKHMKPRPWMSVAADSNMPKIGSEAGKAVGEVADLKATPEAAADRVGKFMANLIRDVIDKQRVGGDPLKRSTIRRKGHARKLIDSGDMRKAITHEVGKESDP